MLEQEQYNEKVKRERVEYRNVFSPISSMSENPGIS
jgi:hypothetical protein